MLYDLPRDYLGFFVFLGVNDGGISGFDDYIAIMNALRPLFERDDYASSTPGFYISVDRCSPQRHVPSLRLRCLSIDASKTLDAVSDFATKHGLVFLEQDPPNNRAKSRDEYKDGREERECKFANFLDANARIGLEMLQHFGVNDFRDLVATYRYDFLPNAVGPEAILVQPLIGKSASYNQLRDRGLDRRYWVDMFRCHRDNPQDPCVGFHFMLNMVWAQRKTVDCYDPAVLRKLRESYEP